MGALGVLALVDAATDTGYGPAGAPVLGLWLNAAQGGLLLGFAMLAVVAAVKRRTAVIFSAVAAVGWATLLVACMAAAARGVYGPLGFDARDGLLYGALAVYHLALLLWFEADQLEGPAWVRERRSSSSPGADSQPR